MAGLSALASIWLRDVAPRTTARGGLVALIVGVGVALVALAQGSNALFLLGGAIAGLGFGPAFAGVFRALSLRAPADERAALLSAVFVVSYLAFSVPAIIAGAAVSRARAAGHRRDLRRGADRDRGRCPGHCRATSTDRSPSPGPPRRLRRP